MNMMIDSRIITKEPTGSCYRICRKAINLAAYRGKIGICKTSTYVYRATIIGTKPNTAIVERCYRDYYKETFDNKWQLIGSLPINPKLPYSV